MAPPPDPQVDGLRPQYFEYILCRRLTNGAQMVQGSEFMGPNSPGSSEMSRFPDLDVARTGATPEPGQAGQQKSKNCFPTWAQVSYIQVQVASALFPGPVAALCPGPLAVLIPGPGALGQSPWSASSFQFSLPWPGARAVLSSLAQMPWARAPGARAVLSSQFPGTGAREHEQFSVPWARAPGARAVLRLG